MLRKVTQLFSKAEFIELLKESGVPSDFDFDTYCHNTGLDGGNIASTLLNPCVEDILASLKPAQLVPVKAIVRKQSVKTKQPIALKDDRTVKTLEAGNPALVGGLYRLIPNSDIDPLATYEQSFEGDRGHESVYADALARKLGGRREVSVPTGLIDVLTDSEVIEVKYHLCWKHAVGQVLMYGLYYPLHNKRVHLFGVLSQEKLTAITQWCRQSGITVTHEK